MDSPSRRPVPVCGCIALVCSLSRRRDCAAPCGASDSSRRSTGAATGPSLLSRPVRHHHPLLRTVVRGVFSRTRPLDAPGSAVLLCVPQRVAKVNRLFGPMPHPSARRVAAAPVILGSKSVWCMPIVASWISLCAYGRAHAAPRVRVLLLTWSWRAQVGGRRSCTRCKEVIFTTVGRGESGHALELRVP